MLDKLDRAAAREALGRSATKDTRARAKAARALLRTVRVDGGDGNVHVAQLGVLEDPSRLIVIRCPRRTGKSQVLCGKVLDRGLVLPGQKSLMFALTRDQARKIFFDELLVWGERLGLELQPRYADLEVHLPNGHRVLIRGAESDADIEKWRGWKLATVAADEAASFHVRLKGAWEKVLQPCLADLRGTFLMAGSPGEILSGTFYDASCPGALTPTVKDGTSTVHSRPYAQRESAEWRSYRSIMERSPEAPQTSDEFTWSLHEWTKKDNTFLPHLWDEALRRKLSNGWGDDNPIWLREDLGIWAAGESSLAYRFNSSENLWVPADRARAWESLPAGHIWHFIIGADLGFRDPFAIEVAACSPSHPGLFHVWEFEAAGMTVNAMGAKLQEVYDAFSDRGGGVDALVGDFDVLGDAMLNQIAEEYGLPIEKAVKKDKRDHIELLNGDLVDGRCKILPDSALARQMATIQWDDKNPLKEKPQPHNDCADAFVYLWRASIHRFAREQAAPPPAPATPEHYAAKLAERNRKLDDRAKADFDPWEVPDLDAPPDVEW